MSETKTRLALERLSSPEVMDELVDASEFGKGCWIVRKKIWGFPYVSINGGTTKWMVYFMEKNIEMDGFVMVCLSVR